MRESYPSVHDLQSTTRLAESWMLQILDTRMGFPSPSLNVVIDYFSHSCLKMCKICLKRTLDATFLDCLALTFCDVIGDLLPEWACLTLRGGTTFLLTSKLADISVSRVRIIESNTTLKEGRWNPIQVSKTCNPLRGLPSRGCSKSWTRGWDSLVPLPMWCLIIFLIRVQKSAQYV